MNALTEAVITIALAIIGLATISVILSRQSNTTSVIQAGASGFGNSLAEAISPITGNGGSPNLSYPGGFGGFGGNGVTF